MENQNTQDIHSVKEVAQQYGIKNIESITQLDGGLVNVSFKAESQSGDFVFQKMSRIWNEDVISDYCEVQSYLRTRGLFVPFLLHTLRGSPFAVKNNFIWRVFEHVPNDNLQESVPETAFQASKMLGRFHFLMKDSTFKPKFHLDGFHDTPRILKKLENIASNPIYAQKAEYEKHTIRFLIEETPKYYLSPSEQKIVIHGDPKMANFLFKDSKAIAMLDLDTMMIASPLFDIGDGFRSWCRKKPSSHEFKKEVFISALEGYNRGNIEYKLTSDKAKKAMALLTLELASRYLIDYFEENYFALSPKYPSRAVQGITRHRRYVQFYKDFIDKDI